jgi:hypothetical protein
MGGLACADRNGWIWGCRFCGYPFEELSGLSAGVVPVKRADLVEEILPSGARQQVVNGRRRVIGGQ